VPDALHFTGNEEADRLIAEEPLALLIGFVLDQQVTADRIRRPAQVEAAARTARCRRIAASPGPLLASS
jgi:hypothetical protein